MHQIDRGLVPSRQREFLWHDYGIEPVAGLDEVGRGPLAGPVVTAAVILPASERPWFAELRDSKRLSAGHRARLAALIRAESYAWSIGAVSAAGIDRWGIAPAVREAMRRAIVRLPCPPAALQIDALRLPNVELPQDAVIHGDARCSAIAAASIVAKVARDTMMDWLDRHFPGYDFARNRGYGTPKHLEALQRLGPSLIHRRSFAPLRPVLP